MSSLKVVDISTVNHSRRDEYLERRRGGGQMSLGHEEKILLGCSFSLESGGGPGNGLLPH